MPQTNPFALGQRWLSNTESELGLGTVVAVNIRTVDILFPATGESRAYALQNAPLTRIQFEVGDTVTSHEGWQLVVESVQQELGQCTYIGTRTDNQQQSVLKETFVDHHFQLNQPVQRLMSGQVDDPKWFDLRTQCIEHLYNHATSPLLGFVGARVDLIPHQLHIASEVGRRHAPRVLLSDEVGLGKTIEAALIIHQQLLTNRAERVLIVVPSSLVHQWLVEMLRRVNLAFSIFDEERCQAMSDEPGNPFESEQLVLCSLDFLTHNSQYYQYALSANWDLMVVDEAHHLTWSEGHASQQYELIEQLAQVTKGVLLLTATPDQLGHESHFARLRLLDSARFHNYADFVAEEKKYGQLANAITPLLSGELLTPEQTKAIEAFSGTDDLQPIINANQQQKMKFVLSLLDRHGTGRVLFRNSRSGVAGFPKRQLKTYPLPMPEQYASLLANSDENYKIHLCPERHASFVDSWTEFDPRVEWFIQILQHLKGQKVLTICANKSTALQLSEVLRVKAAIRAGVFHEGMSIVERDKAANYFAQGEDGAQVLICSEIGSEGRNFQFAQNLVLFDLPLVPDLLEQRIGRLDRIGQKGDITLHTPYFEMSAQHVMLDWYHQGLNAFEHTCPTGTIVFEETAEMLVDCLLNPDSVEKRQLLITQTAELHSQLKHKLEQGRDRLLELNSSGRGKVESLVTDILDAEDSPKLEMFMTKLLDALGILQEEQDDYCYTLRPTETMISQLPGLDEEGMTITYERTTATTLENVHFFSWDHPMVNHAMDMIVTDLLGKSAIGVNIDKSLPPGAYWIECLFVLSAKAQKSLQLDRFLPPTPIKICIDAKGNLLQKSFHQLQAVNQKMAQQLATALQKHIQNAIETAQQFGMEKAAIIRDNCLSQMHSSLGDELIRLEKLQKINPSIRQDEIDHLAVRIAALDELIQSSSLHLEAIRLVVNNH